MNGVFRDVAHIGPAELLTSEFEKSLWFFTDLPAMREVARDGDFGCLHSWGDYEHHAPELPASESSGMGRVAARVQSRGAAAAHRRRRDRRPRCWLARPASRA